VTLTEAIEAAIRTATSRIYKSLPAEVVAYDPTTNTVNAKPCIKVPFFDGAGDREYDELPILPSVPVIWPRAGGNVLRSAIDPGDFVWLMFSDLSLAEWRTTGQTSEPTDARRHSLGHAFAIPGAFPDVDPLSPTDVAEIVAGAMIVGADGGAAQMVVGGTLPGFRFGKLAVSPVALAVPLLAYVSAAAAASTAGGASDTSVGAALTAIQAALVAINALLVPPNGAAAAVAASGVAVTAAVTATGTAATAATAAGTAATTAAGAVPSTLVKAL
jgi:hypothetical protein